MQEDSVLTEDDEGKNVVNSTGDTVGRVMKVQNGTAHVDPDPGLSDNVRSKLGWGDSDEETYQLESDSIETVTDDHIRLNR